MICNKVGSGLVAINALRISSSEFQKTQTKSNKMSLRSEEIQLNSNNIALNVLMTGIHQGLFEFGK
jgi:hypothetical protein